MAMKNQEHKNDKELFEVAQDNKNKSGPLKKKMAKIDQLRKDLEQYEKASFLSRACPSLPYCPRPSL